MSTGKVYVVQNHAYYDEKTGLQKPKFNLDPAKKFGDLVFLLSPMSVPSKPAEAIKKLWEKLKDFSDDDYLLLIGNPCLIGFSVAVAAAINDGRISLLQYNGSKGRYYVVRAQGLSDMEE